MSIICCYCLSCVSGRGSSVVGWLLSVLCCVSLWKVFLVGTVYIEITSQSLGEMGRIVKPPTTSDIDSYLNLVLNIVVKCLDNFKTPLKLNNCFLFRKVNISYS